MAFNVYGPVWNDKETPEPIGMPINTDQDAAEAAEKPGTSPDETDPDKIKANSDVAKAELAQKNRKRRQGPRMELPFDPTMEEGSCWMLSGFAPNFDGKWLVHEVVFSFTGKGGSKLEIDLYATVYDNITTASGVTTVAQKRELTKNPPVGSGTPDPANTKAWLPLATNVAMASRSTPESGGPPSF